MLTAINARPGRVAGTTNYKNDILLNVIDAILPVGSKEWETVAQRYLAASGEQYLRSPDDIKRHFTTKCCNGFKKPTGN